MSSSRVLCCQSAAVAARLRRNAKPQRVPGGVEAPAAGGNRHTWLRWWSEADNADALHTLVAMPWADVHSVDASQRTALHRAVRRHDKASVRLLLSLGLAVDAVDIHRQTPLLLLLSRSQPSMSVLSLLLEAGADVEAADERCVPITYCARHGSLAALQLLLQHSQARATALLETPDPEGRTATFWAATEGQLACLDVLLLAGASADAPSIMGVTPLRAAVSRGGADRHAVVTRLLEAGALVHGAQKGAANSWGAPSARAHRNLIDVALSVHGDAQLAELLATHAARQGIRAEGTP